jgi:cytosolic carboxypeptidase protein 6
MKKLLSILLFLSLFVSTFSQQTQPVFQGQPTVEPVSTVSRPIEKQEKKTFAFDEDQVYFSNQFDGARLTKIERTAENAYTIMILSENSPINMSPWYAFRVWSKTKKEIAVKLVYPEFAKHRYSPQISEDGKKWKVLETERITEFEKGTAQSGVNSRPKSVEIKLKISKKPIYVSAQELQNSRQVFEWTNKLAKKKKFKVEEIGKSSEGRPIRLLKMGNLDSKKMILVISRQHPPEVTGYFAMQAFIEKIADKSKLSKDFRKDWAIYVVPLMNPDGVDNGHWRHNLGGIDLNRDWSAFNQPETVAVREFLKRKEVETDGKFYFGIDFHSTWDDIYYPMNQTFTDTNMPNLVWNWLENIKKAIPNYEPNIQANAKLEPTVVSRNYFLKAHKMEAIVFEIGDNTPRDFIKKKGEVGAIELMKLLQTNE